MSADQKLDFSSEDSFLQSLDLSGLKLAQKSEVKDQMAQYGYSETKKIFDNFGVLLTIDFPSFFRALPEADDLHPHKLAFMYPCCIGRELDSFMSDADKKAAIQSSVKQIHLQAGKELDWEEMQKRTIAKGYNNEYKLDEANKRLIVSVCLETVRRKGNSNCGSLGTFHEEIFKWLENNL